MQVIVTGAVEGNLDEAVLRKVAWHCGMDVARVLGRQGKPQLLKSLQGYNNAARFAPWIVLVDLDQDCDCAPECQAQWLPAPAPYMCCRIAVRAIESWLLADAERFAGFLGIARANLPAAPDELDNPKRKVFELARRSRRRSIQEDLTPRPGSGQREGALYTSRMIEFVDDPDRGWRVMRAARRSPSLRSCIDCLTRLRDRFHSYQEA